MTATITGPYVEAAPLPIIRPEVLAQQLGVNERTLANWRSQNRGPVPTRLGPRGSAVVYMEADVLSWLSRQRVDDTYWDAA